MLLLLWTKHVSAWHWRNDISHFHRVLRPLYHKQNSKLAWKLHLLIFHLHLQASCYHFCCIDSLVSYNIFFFSATYFLQAFAISGFPQLYSWSQTWAGTELHIFHVDLANLVLSIGGRGFFRIHCSPPISQWILLQFLKMKRSVKENNQQNASFKKTQSIAHVFPKNFLRCSAAASSSTKISTVTNESTWGVFILIFTSFWGRPDL